MNLITPKAATKPEKWGEITCLFVPPGGSIVPRYVLQLFLVNSHKIAKMSTTTKAREKISADLESLKL
jgi:hypothetical protein